MRRPCPGGGRALRRRIRPDAPMRSSAPWRAPRARAARSWQHVNGPPPLKLAVLCGQQAHAPFEVGQGLPVAPIATAIEYLSTQHKPWVNAKCLEQRQAVGINEDLLVKMIEAQPATPGGPPQPAASFPGL